MSGGYVCKKHLPSVSLHPPGSRLAHPRDEPWPPFAPAAGCALQKGRLRISLGEDITQGGHAPCTAGEGERRKPAVGSGTMHGLALVPLVSAAASCDRRARQRLLLVGQLFKVPLNKYKIPHEQFLFILSRLL